MSVASKAGTSKRHPTRRLTGIALLALLAVMDSTCNKRDASS
jgi:hypothetical protein